MKNVILIIGVLISQLIFAQDHEPFTDSIAGSPPNEALLIGQIAPPIHTKTIDGEELEMESMKGTIVVLNFWFIACGPCRKEIPFLNQLVEQNKKRTDLRFISISNSDSEKSLSYARLKLQLQFELVAKGQSIADAYRVTGYPTNLIIDKTGKIVFIESGFKEDIKNKIQEVIDSMN